MANVTGPISTLPGALHKVPAGMTCDDHQDRPAAYRVQGETDSFGCEMTDLCQECYDHMQAYKAKRMKEVQQCDWCDKMKEGLRPRRDPDEGIGGPVHQVCPECITKQNASLLEEVGADEREHYQEYLEAQDLADDHDD